MRGAVVLGMVVPLHMTLERIYRPWARQQSFGDWGFSDSFTQVTAIVGIAALMVITERESWWENKLGEMLLLAVPTVSMIGYELLQPWLSWTTFDRMDLVWSVVGGGLAAAIKRFVYDPVVSASAGSVSSC